MKQVTRIVVLSFATCCLLLNPPGMIYAQQQNPDHQSSSTPEPSGHSQGNAAKDPGVRSDNVDAGAPFATLSPNQLSYFNDGQTRFQQVDQVANGLGPTYNSNSCASCHAQPSIGGSSPSLTQYPNIGPIHRLKPQLLEAPAIRSRSSSPRMVQCARHVSHSSLIPAALPSPALPTAACMDSSPSLGAATPAVARWLNPTSSKCSISITSSSAFPRQPMAMA